MSSSHTLERTYAYVSVNFPINNKSFSNAERRWEDRIFPKPRDTQWVETVWKRLIQFTNRNFFPESSGASEWASERTNKPHRARKQSTLFLCRHLQKQTCCMLICLLFICQNLLFKTYYSLCVYQTRANTGHAVLISTSIPPNLKRRNRRTDG